MKKFTKFIYSMFAFMMITCMAMFCPAITSVDAAGLPDGSVEIKTGKIDGEVTKGEQMLIPLASVDTKSANAKTFVEVTDRSGQKFEYEQRADYSGSYFTLLDENKQPTTNKDDVVYIQPKFYGKGVYSVRYKVVDGSLTYYSKTTTIRVTGVTYKWEFNKVGAKNNIIPSITASGSTYTLPIPSIIPSDGETISYDVNDIEVFKNSVKDTSALVVENGVAKFTPVLESGKTSTTYVVKYKSPNASYNLNTESFTVVVQKDYVNTAELEVTHSYISNLQVGAISTFPSANVTDKTHNKDSVDVNTAITIKKVGSDDVVAELINKYEYKFTETGEYNITYTVTDAYGNVAKSKTVTKNVEDLAPYDVRFVEDYNTTATDWETTEDLEKADYLVPASAGFGGFTVPAIYGKDWNTPYANLKFTRKLVVVESAVTGGQKEYNIDLAEDNKALSANNTDFSKAIKFQFPEAEANIHKDKKYTLTYTVEDSIGKTKTISYTITIVDKDAPVYNLDKGLEINLPAITENINSEAEMNYTAASAKETPVDEDVEADTRIQIRNFYYYGEQSVLTNALNAYKSEFKTENDDYNEKYGYDFEIFQGKLNTASKLYELKTVDNKVNLKLQEYTIQRKITVFAVAINDQGQFVIDSQEVLIDNIGEASVPRINNLIDDNYASQLAGQTQFNQNVEVKLPAITFADDHDSSLSVDVKCYVDTPDKVVDVVIKEYDENGIKNAVLNTSYYGAYYVVYTATDDAGNTATYVSTFNVAKTSLAHIEVGNGGNISKKVGEQETFALDLVGEGEYTDVKYTITWGDLKPAGLGSNTNSFRFDKEGTYIATISATYKLNGKSYTAEPSVTVTVNVTKPTITWTENDEKYFTENNNYKTHIGEIVPLRLVNALEDDKEIRSEIKVTFTDKDGKVSDVNIEYDFEKESYLLKTSKDGVYKVTYSAISEYGNSEKTFTIISGDITNPEVFIEEGNSLQDSKITYTDKKITFEVVSFDREKDENDNRITGKYILKVKATEDKGGDNAKELFTKEIKVTLKDTDVNGVENLFNTSNYTFTLTGEKVAKDSTNVWTISGVGTYTLSLTVKDTNGNTSEAGKITFKVVNEAEPKKNNNKNVIGIVLIIVSAVILGGVILFFALAGKRKPRRKNVSAAKADKE